MSSQRRVCVIGAGTAGLCALKHSLEHGMEAIAYEQCDGVGGTWVYSDNTENAPYDKEVHSSMYEGLRTNLPKEVMGFPDFSYPDNLEESFVGSSEVLKFLQSYSEHFDLKSHIKFQHSVKKVRPKNDKWEVTVWDICGDNYIVTYYDFVFVCNGHYTTPLYPNIDGMDVFAGKQLHSHLYRKANVFKGKFLFCNSFAVLHHDSNEDNSTHSVELHHEANDETVLIIGAGPSGMDLANQIHRNAKHVFLSHHRTPEPDTKFMTNVTQKSDVECLTETGAIFKDGTSETFSYIIYCTGYKYTFPWMTSECGLIVDDNWVHPLYKHCININNPTMALIGLPFYVCPNQLFDLQVRFVLKFFAALKPMPSREVMMADMDLDMQERWAKGFCKRQAHQMGENQLDYYKDLAELADIENIKPVIGKIMQDCSRKYIYQLETYRNNRFKVIDDENFIKYPL